MRIDNSPKFEEEIKAYAAKKSREESRAKKRIEAAIAAGLGQTWTPMEDCPLEGFDLWVGSHEAFLITDGKSVTVVKCSKRFGTPVFYKKRPETVYRDGTIWMEGGEIDPRDDLPKWWWKWELKDQLEDEVTYYDSSSKPEVDWVPTHWMFLPKPPRSVVNK